jgi:hypothetical protein
MGSERERGREREREGDREGERERERERERETEREREGGGRQRGISVVHANIPYNQMSQVPGPIVSHWLTC